MQFSPRTILFDAYGTLFDVYAIGQRAESFFPGQGEALAYQLRVRQVDYTRLRSMAGRYKPFSELTRDALQAAAAGMGLTLLKDQADLIMQDYGRLSAFSEAKSSLEAMRGLGLKLAILSNGDPALLKSTTSHAALDGLFDQILSADQVGCYKVDPRVYQLAIDAFGGKAHEMLFVSSNAWDVCGAAWFGFKTFWVNRMGQTAEVLDNTPDYIGRDLKDVVCLVSTLNINE